MEALCIDDEKAEWFHPAGVGLSFVDLFPRLGSPG
jgi:hypothetical protein